MGGSRDFTPLPLRREHLAGAARRPPGAELLLEYRELCFRVWAYFHFNADWKKRIENQILLVPRWDIGKLAAAARRTGAEQIVLEALEARPKELAIFKKKVLKAEPGGGA